MKPPPPYWAERGEARVRAKRDFCAYYEFLVALRDWKVFLHGVPFAISDGRVLLGGITLPDGYRRRDVVALLKTLRAATCPALSNPNPDTTDITDNHELSH
jgi:hypothetical protein